MPYQGICSTARRSPWRPLEHALPTSTAREGQGSIAHDQPVAAGASPAGRSVVVGASLGGRIGSSSLRRRFQLKTMYPKLEYLELRGNVDTRLRKLDAGDFDGIILAAAGLNRLGFTDRINEYISVEHCIPSAGQGAVGVESVTGDSEINELLQAVNHPTTELCVSCERLITLRLGATCNLPIAAFAQVRGDVIHLSSFVSDSDGGQALNVNLSGPVSEARQLAEKVAVILLEKGAQKLISSVPMG